ncbi:hypothetical protein H0H92_006981 [Tricholoma furcatifolium]|nr:hypothetical protein H0H92_006981 [Tricholoma furcatifolium]
MQTKYTIGPEVRANGYHVAVVKSSLNRNLDERFTDVQDELVSSFQEYVPLTQDWTEIGVLPMIRKVISRASNRLFVGLPVCRNPDYRDLNVEFTVDLLKAAQTINLFPNFLKPLIGRYVTNSDSQIQRALLHLRPIIEERLKKEDEFGKDWPGKPAKYAEEKQRTVRDLTLRILTINFAAIHTTSMTFAQVLYDIAANPSFVPALREEIEIITAQDGFSKSSLNKMIKLDSFIKESQRLGGISALSMTRKVMNDFTFSDGTVVPRGHTIAVATYATHLDEDSYENPLEFDGFRFSKMRELQDDAFNKHQMVSLSLDYVVFGIGKQACPGRFFAVHELKVLLAHVLLNYDVAFANNGPRPANSMVAHQVMMDPQAVVMFRKRQSGAV